MKSLLAKFLSTSNFLLAWKVIRKKKVPGIDGITPKDFEKRLYENIELVTKEILKGYYVPAPAIVFNHNGKNGKTRVLGILTVKEQLAQRVIAENLALSLEKKFLPTSFAFRIGKSPDSAIESLRKSFNSNIKWLIKGDIKSFFDEIDREILYKFISEDFNDYPLLILIKKWLEVGVIKNNRLYRYPVGIIQGSPLSPVLSNIYLHRFDIDIKKENFTMIRFADDFCILCKNREDTEKALDKAENILKTLKLQIKPGSVSVIDVNKKFEFLGREVLLRPKTLNRNNHDKKIVTKDNENYIFRRKG